MATTASRPDSGQRLASAPRRIVVVEDDDNVRAALCTILGKCGFAIVGAGRDGLEGVLLANERSPDVVLLDVRMPNLGGLEAARRIRAANPTLRIVILSAYDDPTLQHEAAGVGANAFLVKGCTLVELRQAIEA